MGRYSGCWVTLDIFLAECSTVEVKMIKWCWPRLQSMNGKSIEQCTIQCSLINWVCATVNSSDAEYIITGYHFDDETEVLDKHMSDHSVAKNNRC